MVSNYWSVHLPHVLDEKGTLQGLTGRGLRLATFGRRLWRRRAITKNRRRCIVGAGRGESLAEDY
jgi:hypothetical protein